MCIFGPNRANLDSNIADYCAADQQIGSISLGAQAHAYLTRHLLTLFHFTKMDWMICQHSCDKSIPKSGSVYM